MDAGVWSPELVLRHEVASERPFPGVPAKLLVRTSFFWSFYSGMGCKSNFSFALTTAFQTPAPPPFLM